MSLIILFGYLLVKLKILSEVGTSEIAKMLTKFILPIVLFMAFQQEFSWERMEQLGWAAIGAIVLHLARILVSRFSLGMDDKVDQYASIYTNSGLIGVPLVQALFGYEGVFFVSIYVVISAILQWTYGVFVLTGKRESITLKNAFLNPASIGAGLGFLRYLLPIQLPEIIGLTLENLGRLNAVLGMILVGAYIAGGDIKLIFNSKKAYWTSILISIINPLIGILILWLMPITESYLFFALFIANSAPTAVNTAIFAQMYGKDYKYGASLVIISTLISLIVIPLLLPLVNILI